MSAGQVWEVVGGGNTGGILVRVGKDTASAAESSRLSLGANVRELELDGDRLHYQRLTGSGPDTGWVSVKLKDGKELLIKKEQEASTETAGAQAGSAAVTSAVLPAHALLPDLPADAKWTLIWTGEPARGQQFRLLFAFAGKAFEDKWLKDDSDIGKLKSQSMGDSSPLAFDNLPVVQHGPRSISSAAAIMQYVGESLGIADYDEIGRSRAVMIVVGVQSMRAEAFYPPYERMMKGKKRLTSFLREAYDRWMGHFERYLRTSLAAAERDGGETGRFVLGKKVCYADLSLYDCVTSCWDLGCYGREAERAQKFPRLSALVIAVEKLSFFKKYGRPHMEHFNKEAGELQAAPPGGAPKQTPEKQLWEVVGGGAQNGILVRKAKETSSAAEAERLSTGALVREVQLEGERLQYKRLSGTGPDTGWVSIKLKDKDLLVKSSKQPPVPLPAMLPKGQWQVLYRHHGGRGQQMRLLFEFAGAAFDDKRLNAEEFEAQKSKVAGDASPLAFDFVPIVRHGSYNIATTAGAMQYTGESLGLGGADKQSRAQALMVVLGTELTRNEVFYPAYQAMIQKERRILNYSSGPYETWMGHFERLLRTSAAAANAAGVEAGPFVLGPRVCYADLALYDCVTSLWDLGCYGRDREEQAQKFPRVCALVDAVAAQPSLEKYGQPHGEEFKQIGELPRSRTPAEEEPSPPAGLTVRDCLEQQLAEANKALQDAGGALTEPAPKIKVVIGTSKMAAENKKLAEQLASLVNRSNEAAIADAPSRKGSHKTVTEADMRERLSLGDTGFRTNRVLHVAMQGDVPVGCMTSSLRTPWTDLGVGHWGFLAVDTKMQGKGIASALVSQAMQRLATACTEVHIEYLHTRKHAYSDRLKDWYENKLGFNVVSAMTAQQFSEGGGAGNSAKDTILRICRRKYSAEELALAQRRKLQEVHAELGAQLAALGNPGPPAPACRAVFSKLAAFVKARSTEVASKFSAAFQFEVVDAGQDGKFFVDLRPGLCFAGYGIEASADFELKVRDADLEPWLLGEIPRDSGYWSGRVIITDDSDHAPKLQEIYALCNKV